MEFPDQVVRSAARQLCHVLKIDGTAVGQRDRKRILGRFGFGDGLVAQNNPFPENIGLRRSWRFLFNAKFFCLCLADAFIELILQRQEKRRVGVVVKNRPVFILAEQAVFCDKLIVDLVQVRPGRFDLGVWSVRRLKPEQLPRRIPDRRDHIEAAMTLCAKLALFGPLGLGGDFLRLDRPIERVDPFHEAAAIMEERLGLILCRRFAFTGRLAGHLFGGGCAGAFLVNISRQEPGCTRNLPLDVEIGDGPAFHVQRDVQGRGVRGRLLSATVEGPEHHLRSVDEPLVERDRFAAQGIGHQPGLGPGLIGCAPLLIRQLPEEHQVGGNFRAGVLFEGVVGQPDCAKKLDAVGDPRSGQVPLRVEEPVGHHHAHDAAGPQFHDGPGEEVVVDGKCLDLRLERPRDALRSKRRVPHSGVEVIVG